MKTENIKWSPMQTAIFDAVAKFDGPNLIVEAGAGTGKTATILASLEHADPDAAILLCAFNKGIKSELEKRVAASGLIGIDVRTMHSIGMGALRYKLGDFTVDSDKPKKIAREIIPSPFKERDKGEKFAAIRHVLRLVGLGKNTLAGSVDQLIALGYSHGLGDPDHEVEDLAAWAFQIMDAAREQTTTIDFDDMVWLPSQIGAKPKGYDLIYVDEAQDLNPAQLWVVNQMLERRDGRLIAVGDDRQAIYGWRGAGSGVLGQLRREFDADHLPLSISYRCPRKVVKLAQEVAPEFRCAPNAPEGEIIKITRDAMLAKAQPGDFILSRTNAPLVGACLRMLRDGTPATIAGRDIGVSLKGLLTKPKVVTVPDYMLWLGTYIDREAKRLEDEPDALALVYDRCGCVRALCEGEETVADVVAKIDGLFSEVGAFNGRTVICSTVHKAKGLEADRVWVLADTFRRGKTEEDNIWYVAITRAKKILGIVRG